MENREERYQRAWVVGSWSYGLTSVYRVLMEEKPFNLIELYIAFSADHP
jgi:hypothetical protein